MGKFHEKYNKLLMITIATKRFERQLAKARINSAQLFSQLAPIFIEDGRASPFAVCLIHRHYLLEEGERMVTEKNSTKPTRNDPARVIAERWLKTGEEIEHRLTENLSSLLPPPSAGLLAKFNSIVDAHGINVLGICYAPDPGELAPGHVFWESAGSGDREQVLTVVHNSFLPLENTIESSWVPIINSNEQRPSMLCTHSCIGCPP